MFFKVDFAVSCAHEAIMGNHGQNCCAASRTYVHESIYEEFVHKSKELAENRKVGNPFDSATQQGPLVSKLKYFNISKLVLPLSALG